MKETQREVNGGGTPRQSKKEGAAKAQDVAELKDYVGIPYGICCVLSGISLTRRKQLGDCLGKGAFGSVFRALNMGTGETVAVKQIKLADLPKSELKPLTVR